LEYDSENHETKIILDPQKEFYLPFALPNYAPLKLILQETPDIKARALVR
jgi:hypothetical protein